MENWVDVGLAMTSESSATAARKLGISLINVSNSCGTREWGSWRELPSHIRWQWQDLQASRPRILRRFFSGWKSHRLLRYKPVPIRDFSPPLTSSFQKGERWNRKFQKILHLLFLESSVTHTSHQSTSKSAPNSWISQIVAPARQNKQLKRRRSHFVI